MRQIPPYPLWLGHVGDAHNLAAVLDAGIEALVDLAINEPPLRLTRELIYCRFPLMDGSGNAAWLLKLAVDTTAGLIRARTPTLLFCGAGMSRTVAVGAAVLAMVSGESVEKCLADVVNAGPADLAPALWRDVRAVLNGGVGP